MSRTLFAKTAYAEEHLSVDLLLADPSVGLYSSADASKGSRLAQKIPRRARRDRACTSSAQPIEDLGAHVVRVHQRGSGNAQVSDHNAGWQERDTTWGMIAGAESPVVTR